VDEPAGDTATTAAIKEIAARANVPEAFVRRLVGVGMLLPLEGSDRDGDVRRARLLHSWDRAALPAETVANLVEQRALSLAFLDAPSLAGPRILDASYRDLAASVGLTEDVVQQLHEALGFESPSLEDRVREDDAELAAVAKVLLSAGASESSLLGLVRVYADSVRRVAKAESELYEAEVEQRLRNSGLTEQQLIEFGSQFGDRLLPSFDRMLLSFYRHHREHVWIEHAVNHAEAALEQMGQRPAVSDPPAICFVDLTGYTRMTEERGDEVAARAARSLASLVTEISLRAGGRPIRWLGDGGMFHFRQPRDAVLSGLEMTERAPGAGLPPMHIGVHTGPVIFQDGDVYGRTVNLASRIASQADGGEVLVSEDTVTRSGDHGLHFQALPPVELKGIRKPMQLYRAERSLV
jgi:adenylate cyclase